MRADDSTTSLYVRTSPEGRGLVTVAIVLYGDREVSQELEVLVTREFGLPATTMTRQELFDREGTEGVERAEREADSEKARQLIGEAQELVRKRNAQTS